MTKSSSGGSPPFDQEKAESYPIEQDILESQLRTTPSTAGYFAIFRYAKSVDLVIMCLSIVACSAAGAGAPLMMVVLGSTTGKFSSFLGNGVSSAELIHSVDHLVLYFVYIGVAQIAALTAGNFGLNYVGERVTSRLRKAFLDGVLRQNTAFFDNIGAGEIATRISNDMSLVQDGISQKVGLIFYGVAGFLSALAISFVRAWELALVLLCLPFVILLVMGVLGSRMKQYAELANAEYAQSGTFAEEVISSIRQVTAYGSQQRFLRKYATTLDSPERSDFIGKLLLGIMMAVMLMIINLGYGLSFWQGNRFLQHGHISVSDLITVLFTSAIAGIMLGHSAPFIAAVAQAGAAATRIFTVIERPSPIDPMADKGKTLDNVRGAISFHGVKFRYPSRQNQTVLDEFNLEIPAGKTVAIVGPSGSGKTTILSLLERFYLPLRGRITLDGTSIADLNLRWLRSQISIVPQDIFLFNTSIYQNIAYGLGPKYKQLTDEGMMKRVEDAARIANAHSFIMDLPDGYNTNVGERGSRLSGGQRQRVAIARAIVSDPKILLLDEATASLDTKSERLVHEALFCAAKGRTTLIVAHRLSTIREADEIVVVDGGRVIEKGSHGDLLTKGTRYAALVKAQQLRHDYESNDHRYSEALPALKDGPTDTSGPADRALAVQQAAGPPQQGRSFGQLASLVWRLNNQERRLIMVGLVFACIAGSGFPIVAIFFGNAVISLTDPQLSNGGHSPNFWCIMFLMLGLALLIAHLTQGYLFAVAGSRLGSRARLRAFTAILKQDVAFFDRDENSSGSLTAFLAVEATRLNGISGNTLGAMLNAVVTLASGIAVSCSFGWKLGLVATATMPLTITCGFLRFWAITETEGRVKRATSSAAQAGEAVSGIRTVAALAMEETVCSEYAVALMDGHARNRLLDFTSALMYAMTQSMQMFVNALLFWYGGTQLIAGGQYTVREFFVCYIAVIFSAQAAGTLFSYAPEISGAREAASSLLRLLESSSEIDVDSNEGKPVENLAGDVTVHQVDFAYPAKPEHPVLEGITLKADRGTFIALVGGSGSGKSTALSLVERFYDPSSGTVSADAFDLRELRVKEFRKNVALVEQQSALIGGSIRECLLSDDEPVDDKAIEEACRAANIYDFVVSLPEGLNSSVGAKGNRVSGGQKQRLAIAKALLRKPTVLLLDEATSALDSESEKVVQLALSSAAKGRTTLAAAHRLSTIAHADCIYVFDHGRIVESGTHEDLVKKKGRYFELVTLQDLGQ